MPTESSPSVAVLTGPVHSGKTTRLMTRAASQPSLGGIVSSQEGATRWFRDLRDLAAVPMDASAEAPEETVQRVGRFRFRTGAFFWAAERMESAFADPAVTTVVLDEVGPLELRGLGFAPWLPRWIAAHGDRLLLVVRDEVIVDISDHFGFIPQPEVVA